MTVSLWKYDTLLVVRRDATLFVTLNRPEVRNALNSRMWTELEQVFTNIRDDHSLRTIVLRGANGTFCAGGDINERSTVRDADAGSNEIRKRNRRAGRIFDLIDRSSKAVVAVVEGHAYGGGFGLATVSDVTLALKDARFRLPEVTLGIAPAQIIPFLMRRIGSSNLRHIATTAMIIDAVEAHRIGLVHSVCADQQALEARIEQTLSDLNRASHTSIATAKKLIAEATEMQQDAFLDHAAEVLAKMVDSRDGREGADAFRNRRAPSWDK